jgi:hypothetical protein
MKDAMEMLKLGPDAFMVEVSRAISPKPWKHELGPVLPVPQCSRCGHVWKDATDYHTDSTDCSVPPPITDHPAVVAERLIDMWRHRPMEWSSASVILRTMQWECGCRDGWAYSYWFGFIASTAQRIAVCLVALDLWQIGEKP